MSKWEKMESQGEKLGNIFFQDAFGEGCARCFNWEASVAQRDWFLMGWAGILFSSCLLFELIATSC